MKNVFVKSNAGYYKQNNNITPKTHVLGYILTRLLLMVPTVLGVITLTFLLVHIVPGDPITALLGDLAQPADRAAMAHALGLDQPLLTQYINYLKGIVTGDWGTSILQHKPVLVLLWERLPATLSLAALAMVFALSIALPLGIIAAVKRDRAADKAALGFSLIAFSMPNFWLGPLLMIVFGIWLGLLPVAGADGWQSIILPALTLGTGMSAMTLRLMRGSLLDVLSLDYMRTAKAKGYTWGQAVLRHGVPNALLPVVTIVFLQAGALLTGAIVTETVFAWPGVGSLMIEALNQRDYPLIQACVLFISLVYVCMSLLADLTYALVDPRIRYGGQA